MLKLHYVLEQAVLGGVWQEFLIPILVCFLRFEYDDSN